MSITNPDELSEAQRRLLRLVETDLFFAKKTSLLKSRPQHQGFCFSNFFPYIGTNELRCATGCPKQLEVTTYDVENRFLIESRHLLVRIHLQPFNDKYSQQGVEYMRALIQEKFAIVKLRNTLDQPVISAPFPACAKLQRSTR